MGSEFDYLTSYFNLTYFSNYFNLTAIKSRRNMLVNGMYE